MRITFFEKTKLSLAVLISLLMAGICLAFFFFIVTVFDPDGGTHFFDNLLLAVPVFLTWILGGATLILGILSLIVNPKKSVIVILFTLIGGFIFWWGWLEILFE
jgi:hypothetical protein